MTVGDHEFKTGKEREKKKAQWKQIGRKFRINLNQDAGKALFDQS